MNTKWRNSLGVPTKVQRVDLPEGGPRLHSFSDIDEQHHRLQDLVKQLRCWLYEVEQFGVPKFGETGFRLRHFQTTLMEHFDCCRKRRGENCDPSIEQESKLLLMRLTDLIGRLEMPDPPFESWQELVRCLKEFSDDLECLETRLVGPKQ